MIFDFIEIDKTSQTAMCAQLYEKIKNAIFNGQIEENQKLPSIRHAAEELEISRTTVETAYLHLCNEGLLESRPQSGYFVQATVYHRPKVIQNDEVIFPIRYDFSSKKIDLGAADITLWKKHIRAALNNEKDIVSYGEPRGEKILREAISHYAYTARGVLSSAENVIIGAGTQALLMLLCSLLPKDTVIALEYPGFKQAELIFHAFGLKTVLLEEESVSAKTLEQCGADIYLDVPANKPKMSLSLIRAHRDELLSWVKSKPGRLILEDDYNGELRYRARPIPAMQNHAPQNIIYLGSFSKLLLPSVRIAYMVLPNLLLQKYEEEESYTNQTASKVEQIALANYINHGHLEKHLRRLRKLYYNKSRCLVLQLQEQLPVHEIRVLETSLSILLELETELEDKEILQRALKNGVMIDSVKNKVVKLSFAGIDFKDIMPAVEQMKKAWDIPRLVR